MVARLAHRRGPTPCLAVLADGSGGLAGEEIAARTLPDGSAITVAWCGRLDNRRELFRALAGHAVEASSSDAGWVAAAYERWGAECPAHLDGDFAFALWDPGARSLLCARDIFGVKPFYYAHDAEVFRFASEIAPLFAGGLQDRRVNRGMAAEFLACGITSATDTLYAAVERLSPAHALLVTQGSIRMWRYWAIDPALEVRCATDAEYAERFEALFTAAVRKRVPSSGAFGVTLSGGIDSSGVAALAARIEPQGRACTFSLVFPGRADADESPYLAAVASAIEAKSRQLAATGPSRDVVREAAAAFDDFPGYPNVAMFDALRRAAAADGVRLLLTGEGGDEWFSGSYYHYADLLRRGRLVALARQLRDDGQIAGLNGVAFPAARLWRLGVVPLVPRRLRRAAGAIRRLRSGGAPSWMRPSFAREVDLPARLREADSTPAGVSYAQQHALATIVGGVNAHYLEVAERAAAACGVVERHPFYDRALVEFAFALPEDQRWRGADTKFVIRGALRGVVPRIVLERRTKAHFSFVYAELLAQYDVRTGWHPLLAEWLDLDDVRRRHAALLHAYRAHDDKYTDDIWPVWMAVGMNEWLLAAAGSGVQT